MADWQAIGATRDILGEGLCWSPRLNSLYWVDIIGQRLHRLSVETGMAESWAMPDIIGWVIERREHSGLIAGLRGEIVELDLDPFAIRPILRPEPDMPDNRLNDAKADDKGRIWAGTMPLTCDRPDGSLYRLDPDHALTWMESGYTVTNGPAIAPDGRTFYHTDSELGLVYRMTLDEEGRLHDRAIHIRFEADWGLPDGMTTDAEGSLWIAHWGGGRVSRFDPDGRMERSIALPVSQITNCTFGGAKLDRMFVTSASLDRKDEPLAGALFEIDPGVTGLSPNLYAG